MKKFSQRVSFLSPCLRASVRGSSNFKESGFISAPVREKTEKNLTEALSHGEEGRAADYTNSREKGAVMKTGRFFFTSAPPCLRAGFFKFSRRAASSLRLCAKNGEESHGGTKSRRGKEAGRIFFEKSFTLRRKDAKGAEKEGERRITRIRAKRGLS